jgi:hypothetical protein
MHPNMIVEMENNSNIIKNINVNRNVLKKPIANRIIHAKMLNAVNGNK